MNKNALRSQLISARIKDAKKDKMIFDNFCSLREFENAGFIFTYISVNSEPDTTEIIKEAFKRGKRVAVPVCEKNDPDMKCIEIFPGTRFVKGLFNIPEPVDRICAPTDELDLIIAPGLGFDESGRRIGYGKGYYDIFLKKHPGLKAAALAYESQILNEIPTDGKDENVDIIITERRIIRI